MKYHIKSSKKGSITIETAILIPTFLTVLLIFLSILELICAKCILHRAALESADTMCKWAPIYKNLVADNIQNDMLQTISGGLEESFDEEIGGLLNQLLQTRKLSEYSFDYIYGFMTQKLCEAYIYDDDLVKRNVVNFNNINLYKSEFFSNDTNKINIKAVCEVDTFLPFITNIGIEVKCKAWGKGVMPHLSYDIETEDEASKSIWSKDNITRGKIIRQMYGGNLPDNFPVIASFENGTATMIKSVNHTLKTYQDARVFEKNLKDMIDSLAAFDGFSLGGINIKSNDIIFKKIILVMPENEYTLLQQNTMEYIMKYSAQKLIVLDLQRYQKV